MPFLAFVTLLSKKYKQIASYVPKTFFKGAGATEMKKASKQFSFKQDIEICNIDWKKEKYIHLIKLQRKLLKKVSKGPSSSQFASLFHGCR